MGPGGTQRHLGSPPGPEGQGLAQEGLGAGCMWHPGPVRAPGPVGTRLASRAEKGKRNAWT